MSDIPKVTCTQCGEDKEPFLFTPGELGGRQRCRKCVSAHNAEQPRRRTVVPGADWRTNRERLIAPKRTL